MPSKVDQDGGTEHVTYPGDDTSTHPLNIHHHEETVAAYLGFTHVIPFRRFCFTPRALHVARIIGAYSLKARTGVQLDLVYNMFRRCDSDDTFQATYRVSNETINSLFQGNDLLLGPNTDKAVVLANILVWACDMFAEAVGTADPTWQGAEYPDCVEKLLSNGDVNAVIPMVSAT